MSLLSYFSDYTFAKLEKIRVSSKFLDFVILIENRHTIITNMSPDHLTGTDVGVSGTLDFYKYS